MSKPKPYNGHRSWNAWNVSLWIDNDEGLYNAALEAIRQSRYYTRQGVRRMWDDGKPRLFRAVNILRGWLGDVTPDGAKYNGLCVRLVLEDMIEEGDFGPEVTQ